MKQFEHSFDSCSTDEHHMQIVMDRRGRENWELVSVVLQNQCWKFFWKREKTEIELKRKKASTEIVKTGGLDSEW